MITDKMLAEAAAELNATMLDSLPDPAECRHTFSKHFERKMKRLIYRTNHPIQHRILRSAASILLVILLGFSSVLAVSVEARAAVFGWIRDQYESFYAYFFEGESEDDEPVSYCPGWIPDEFKYETTFEIAGGKSFVYVSSDGTIAEFSYSASPENFVMFIESVDCEQHSVLINGIEGPLYIPSDSSMASGIVWIDENSNTIFHVSATINSDILMKIAEQIKIIE